MKLTALKGKSFIRLKDGLLGLLIIVALTLLILRVQRPSPENPQPKANQFKSQEGYMAPRFSLRNLKGNMEGLDDHLGKVIVVNFWATWCVPCVKEMPSFENLYRRYRSQGLTLLAVSLDKGDSTKVQEFADKHKLSFPILLDTKGVAEKLYPSFSIPFTYVIDKQGRVVARVDGAKNWESSETFEAVEHLLKQ
ncbi:MAG: TlpA disulfide reductase family protein [Nitrospinaceae bacterium]|jgi:peroxiredoxin|nr:redoxin domain-containing protein [Nitrospinaceae bacterium]|tara:strand:- start:500 stop:1081 length:582 start_codon:yes stop_codon:yes gene_type:complete